MGGGNGHGTQLVQGEHGDPPLQTALQNEHHHIAMTDAQLLQVDCCLVAALLQVGESQANFLAFVVGPKQCQLVGLFFSPCIHYVVSKIKVLWNDEFQVLLIVVHRRERCFP